ncbi:hypothetical protein FRC03_006740 [Tulasnella sp. 419]|nr:hypothetical protein FRC03_006740 [Tulasnella sp. 419]
MLSNAFLPFASTSASFPSSQPSSSQSKTKTSSATSSLSVPNTTPSVSTQTLLAISEEYTLLRNSLHCPTGIYIIPSQESALLWKGVLFIHQGYYASSVLRFQLTFPSNYPEKPPVIHFITDVFHPLISQKDGLFSLTKGTSKTYHIFDVLHWIKSAFKKSALDQLVEGDCLNKEAFNLYRNSTASFAALAMQTSGLSQSPAALFDRDHPRMGGKEGSASITFKQLTESELNEMRRKVGVHEWKLDVE